MNIYTGKYSKWYDQLVQRARNRSVPVNYSDTGEYHHVIPTCIGGSNDESNLVYLTFAEHYVAHQLLQKIYPDNDPLKLATSKMCQGRNGTNKLFEWIRKEANEANRRLSLERWKDPDFKAKFMEKISTPEYKAKHKLGISTRPPQSKESNMKKGLHAKGKLKPPEQKMKMSIASAGKPKSTEHRAALVAAWVIRRQRLKEKKESGLLLV